MTERFLWRAPFWSVDLAFAGMPLVLLIVPFGARQEGKPLPFAAEIAFSAFALVFAVLLLRAHLRPRYALTLDEEGVRAEVPGALIGRHPWRLRWGEIRRAVVVTGPEYRTLLFEPVVPGPSREHYAAVLAGGGREVTDEPGLLAALARCGLPVLETAPPITVSPGREFLLQPDRSFMTRAVLGIFGLAPLLIAAGAFAKVRSVTGPIRFLEFAAGLSFLIVGVLAIRKVRGTRWLLLVGDEGVAYIERSPGRSGKPPTEQLQWALPWRDIVRVERRPDALVFETEIAPRAVPFGAAPKPDSPTLTDSSPSSPLAVSPSSDAGNVPSVVATEHEVDVGWHRYLVGLTMLPFTVSALLRYQRDGGDRLLTGVWLAFLLLGLLITLHAWRSRVWVRLDGEEISFLRTPGFVGWLRRRGPERDFPTIRWDEIRAARFETPHITDADRRVLLLDTDSGERRLTLREPGILRLKDPAAFVAALRGYGYDLAWPEPQ